MSAVVRFRAVGPSEVFRWQDGEHAAVGPPPDDLGWVALGIVLLPALLVPLAMIFAPGGIPGDAFVLASALCAVGLSAVIFLLRRLFRRLQRREVRADRSGVHSPGRSIPWSEITGVVADLVEWRLDGGDSGGHGRYFEHAVILVRAEDRLAFFVDSADQAETLAERLSFLRSGARGSPEDVPEALRPLTARATQPQ